MLPTKSTTAQAATTNPVANCDKAKLTGTVFGSTPSYQNDPNTTFDKAYDGDITTYFDYLNPNGGLVGLDLGVNTKASLSSVCLFPRPAYYNDTRVNGAIIQGSNDNLSYTNIVTISGVVQGQWTEVNANNTTPYRYYRYLSPDGSYSNIAEIKFFGSVSIPPAS
ncbi:MAG: hypothetical protein H7230_01920 [Candidatus Parcubacteria bacterium]|nr:hypothetical protein [Candidatus Paceibacterota bacterium]